MALAARGFGSDFAADFGMVLITDLVSGLASLPEIPGLAGTGLVTACLVAAGVTDLTEDFLASGFAAGNAFFGADLAAADLDEAAGRATGFGADFTTGLTAGLTAGLTEDLAGDLASGLTGLPDLTTGLLASLGAGPAFAVVFNPLRTAGFTVILDRVLAGAFAGAAGFFLAVLAAVFIIGLLSKSASHG